MNFTGLIFIILLGVSFYLLFKFRRKGSLLVSVLLLFPTIMVWGDHCPDNERYFTHVPSIKFFIPLFSFLDIAMELMSHQGREFSGSEWYYDVNFIVQIYSLALIVIFYYLLTQFNIAQIKSNFSALLRGFYNKFYFWGGFGILLLVNVLFFHEPEGALNSHTFSAQNLDVVLIYLGLFFAALFITSKKYFDLEVDLKKALWLLVLVFPVVSVSDDYRSIPLCGSEGNTYERILNILPLINAVPKTILSLFQDYNREGFELSVISAVKGYTLLQSLLVLFFFPTLLNVNEETKAKFL